MKDLYEGLRELDAALAAAKLETTQHAVLLAVREKLIDEIAKRELKDAIESDCVRIAENITRRFK